MLEQEVENALRDGGPTTQPAAWTLRHERLHQVSSSLPLSPRLNGFIPATQPRKADTPYRLPVLPRPPRHSRLRTSAKNIGKGDTPSAIPRLTITPIAPAKGVYHTIVTACECCGPDCDPYPYFNLSICI